MSIEQELPERVLNELSTLLLICVNISEIQVNIEILKNASLSNRFR